MLSTVGRGIVQHRGHFGSNGPALASQPWGPRGRLGGMGILMVKDSSPDAAREVILDTSAPGFLTGSSSAAAYLTYLQKRGSTSRRWLFGRTKKGISTSAMCKSCGTNNASCCQFSGRRGELLATVILGSTPFLLGKPIMEQLELVLDLREGVVRWRSNSCAWSRGQVTTTS